MKNAGRRETLISGAVNEVIHLQQKQNRVTFSNVTRNTHQHFVDVRILEYNLIGYLIAVKVFKYIIPGLVGLIRRWRLNYICQLAGCPASLGFPSNNASNPCHIHPGALHIYSLHISPLPPFLPTLLRNCIV